MICLGDGGASEALQIFGCSGFDAAIKGRDDRLQSVNKIIDNRPWVGAGLAHFMFSCLKVAAKASLIISRSTSLIVLIGRLR
jgi:hypothetical protein